MRVQSVPRLIFPALVFNLLNFGLIIGRKHIHGAVKICGLIDEGIEIVHLLMLLELFFNRGFLDSYGIVQQVVSGYVAHRHGILLQIMVEPLRDIGVVHIRQVTLRFR